jgi:hypothetical protein
MRELATMTATIRDVINWMTMHQLPNRVNANGSAALGTMPLLTDHPVELGGPSKEVEMDELHQGAYRPGQWVLGMVERGARKCVMIPVTNCTAQTLLPSLQNVGGHMRSCRITQLSITNSHLLIHRIVQFTPT